MGRKSQKPVESVLKEHNDVTLKAFMVNDLHLSGNELIIFAVIYSFSQDGESCFYGSRKYLASWCQIHEGAVDYQLKKLLQKGLITKTQTRRQDGSRCNMLRANLPVIESIIGQSQKFESGDTKIYDCHQQKFSTSHSQKFMSNKEEPNTKEDTKEDKEQIPFSEIISYYNEKTGHSYSPEAKETVKVITKAWKLKPDKTYEERLSMFKKIIDNMCIRWIGTTMEQWLVPSTIFRECHFDDYLNATAIPPRQDGKNQAQRRLDIPEYSDKTGTYYEEDGRRYVYVDNEHMEEIERKEDGDDFEDIDLFA